MSKALRFEILGLQRAWYDDRELDIGPGKQRAVLAVLLLSAVRPVPTSQIIDAVWPEEPPANGPNVVQKYVAGLRRVLEPERSPRTPGQVLTLTDAGYLLRVAPDAVDAVRFERGIREAQRRRAEGRIADALTELTAALRLWQGEPFAGLSGPVFESARQRLVEIRAAALESWAELELQLGRHRELIGELMELVAEFPVRERLWHQLMLALYRSGRQAEALAAYREIFDLLREEYGIAPGDALQELHGRILRSDPLLSQPLLSQPLLSQPAPAEPLPSAAELPSPAPPVSPPPPFSVVSTDAPLPAASMYGDGAPPLLSAVLPVDAGRRLPRRAPQWLSTLSTILGSATVLLSFGSLTWLVMLGYAVWRRSWRLAAASAGYLAFVAVVVYVLGNSDPEAAEATDLELLLVIGLFFAWLGGTAHVILLSHGVWAAVTGGQGSRDARATEERRIRREQARYLLHHYPVARHELRIGRPDLPRDYDDGGLVDVNAVPDHVIAGLPGLTSEQCWQIVTDRWLRGPFASMEELAGRCLLSPALTDSLWDIMVFLPHSLRDSEASEPRQVPPTAPGSD